MPLICEGIVTTRNIDGTANISPMGPLVNESLSELTFRPFQSSQTYRNLKRTGQGVFHVVDDVLLIARAALNQFDKTPELFEAKTIEGDVLHDCCRWFEFEVTRLDDAEERTTIETRITHCETLRDFFGFNRARHAVLELTILCTRLFLLSQEEVLAERERLRIPVEKTAGTREAAAFDLLADYIDRYDFKRNESA